MSQERAADQSVLVGRSYTRARRHPWVIGKIQGWTIPLGPFTATQLGVLAVGLWLLVQTFTLWSRLGVGAAVVVALPFAATWAVRHAQIEGRAPLRALAGHLALWTAPRTGLLRGRPLGEPRPTTLTGLVTLTPPGLPPASPAKPVLPAPANPSPPARATPSPAARAHPPTSPVAQARQPAQPRPTGLRALLADLDEEE